MKLGVARALTYAALVAVVAIALRFIPQLPDRRPAVVQQAAVPLWKVRFDTLNRGENLRALLRRDGLTDTAANRAIRAILALDRRPIPSGMPIKVGRIPADSAPSNIMVQMSIDHVVHLQRYGESWSGVEDSLPWKTDTIAIGGAINSNLFAAMDQAAANFLPAPARERLTELLADVFEYKVDMSRDIQRGDEFKVIAIRSIAPNGSVKIGNVLAAKFTLSRSVSQAVRFASSKVPGDFFDPEGKSLRAAFLRAPLEFRRISSVFGMREHPILGDVRMHEGTDYAAATGTTVRAIGDGVITRAGWGNGYGNVIEIRHTNGFVTRYGHMRNFASGVRVGMHVHMGETIGYVGSTGLATGPHLHFEVIVNGVQRDPRTALSSTAGDPIPQTELNAFISARDKLLAMLDSSAMGAATIIAQR